MFRLYLEIETELGTKIIKKTAETQRELEMWVVNYYINEYPNGYISKLNEEDIEEYKVVCFIHGKYYVGKEVSLKVLTERTLTTKEDIQEKPILLNIDIITSTTNKNNDPDYNYIHEYLPKLNIQKSFWTLDDALKYTKGFIVNNNILEQGTITAIVTKTEGIEVGYFEGTDFKYHCTL